MADKLIKEKLMADAVKAGLGGGRRFVTEHHRKAFEYLAGLISAEKDKDNVATIASAMVGLCNQSAIQQKLESAGLIDRNEKGKREKSLFGGYLS